VQVDFDPGWRRNIAPEQAALLDHLGSEIERDAQANAPVRTGALRDSLHHTVDGDTVSAPTSPTPGSSRKAPATCAPSLTSGPRSTGSAPDGAAREY
jgi:hypothetical protein